MKKIFAGIACFTLALNLNAGSVHAQQNWNSFVGGIFQELGSEATRQILRSMFSTSAEARRAEQSQRSISCVVIDPTGTPLNVRSAPNGSRIVTTLSNGRRVTPYRVTYDEQNRHWILVGDSVDSLGWVFGPYVSCSFD